MPCFRSLLSSISPGCPSGQRAVAIISCPSVNDFGIGEVRRDFSLFSIIVKVWCDAEEYLGYS